MLRRILAWIALVFFIFIVVNLLFIHFYPTESATVFLIYVLIFIFGTKSNLFQTRSTQISGGGGDEQPEGSDFSEESGVPENSASSENPCVPENSATTENSCASENSCPPENPCTPENSGSPENHTTIQKVENDRKE